MPHQLATIGNDAHKLHKRICKLKHGVKMAFLELAAYLKEMRDRKLYETLGHPTFTSYLGSPELSLERTSVYRLIETYERFILQLQVPPERLALIAGSKLEELLPHVGTVITADTCEDWLHKAEMLSVSDLKDEVAEATGKKSKRLCSYLCRWCTLKGRSSQPAECLVCQEKL